MTSPNYAISTTNLKKEFTFPIKTNSFWLKNLLAPTMKTVCAVENVSFNVMPGESLAFIGPNGAGKSTTIKLLTGILTPSAGDVEILGLSPHKNRQALSKNIGCVFGQRTQLLPNLPLTDSLELFGALYDIDKSQLTRRVSELIELFDMQEFLHQPVRKLSLGQRMRAEIAASLVHKPKILFLDEPSIGLDVVAKKQLRTLLKRLNQEEGLTLFLTSHDVRDISFLCDRTIVINSGTLVIDKPTSELITVFGNEKIIEITPAVEFTVWPELPAGLKYTLAQPQKIAVLVDTSTIALKQAMAHLLSTFELQDMDVSNPDLESVIQHIYANT